MILAILAAAATVGGATDAATHTKYAIQIEPVREVCLLGHADLSYWEPRLELEGLHPKVDGDQAELLICTSSSSFMGVKFNEGIITVSTSREKGGGQRDGLFIVRAFNSVRFFAWVERVRNKSPYYFSRVSNGNRGDQSYLELIEGGQPVFEARMVGAHPPGEVRENLWEGPIYLPKSMNPKAPLGMYFEARLEGPTAFYPFLPGQDVLSLGAPAVHPVTQDLVASHFVATEWWVRDAGRHAKTDSIAR